MTIEKMKELARYAAQGKAPANFECENVNDALSDAIKSLCSSVNDFMRNKYDIYAIITENADEIVPNNVISAIGQFAEVQVVPQGTKVMFKKGELGKNRAKKFITRAALSGVYETFRLDADTFSIDTHAVGGAITMDFERFLDGAETLASLMEILTDGLTNAVFVEVQRALIAAINETAPVRPVANKYSDDAFVAEEMQKLVTTVKSYGASAVIFACPEFIDAMGPDAVVPAISGAAQGIYHPDDIDAIHFSGRIKIFRGTPIIEMPQSFVDETNLKTWMNPQYAFIFPAGKEKVVKVVIEGNTQMYDFTNRDQSVEVHAYRKLGCAILHHHDWAVYRNTGVTDNSYNPYGM